MVFPGGGKKLPTLKIKKSEKKKNSQYEKFPQVKWGLKARKKRKKNFAFQITTKKKENKNFCFFWIGPPCLVSFFFFPPCPGGFLGQITFPHRGSSPPSAQIFKSPAKISPPPKFKNCAKIKTQKFSVFCFLKFLAPGWAGGGVGKKKKEKKGAPGGLFFWVGPGKGFFFLPKANKIPKIGKKKNFPPQIKNWDGKAPFHPPHLPNKLSLAPPPPP